MLQRRFILFLLVFLTSSVFAQHPQIGGYYVYFGCLHNHSEISDGTGTPFEAYYTAKHVAGLDFFSLSDHAEFMTQSAWSEMRKVSDSFNEDGVFTAFWGFEWSSIMNGHMTVIGSEAYCSSLSSEGDNIEAMNLWLDACNCVAFLNHPGGFNTFNLEFNHFNLDASGHIVGMELWNGSKGFDHYYYNDGYDEHDGGLGYYDEALRKGWRIGATGAGDVHSSNWGSGDYRMAVLAQSLSRNDVLEAFMSRRFYSTLDKNLEMSFKINDREMGSILYPGAYSGDILLHDPDNEIMTKAELIQNGQVVQTFDIKDPNPALSFHVDASQSDYYYLRITQEDGDQAISSPIFFDDDQVVTGRNQNDEHTESVIVSFSSDNRLFILLPETCIFGYVIITDLSGRIISEIRMNAGERVEMLRSDFKPGVYLLFIQDHPELGSYKIVIW